MVQDPELSIIIPSFNTSKLLINCLKSIYRETTKINFEIIVIDNASGDDSVFQINKLFKKIRLIKNKVNLGYAKANNQGIKSAKGNYLLFLNSDTIILDNAIEKALDYLKKTGGVDILGCKILNNDKSIQQSGGFFPNLWQVFTMMFFIDDLPFINTFIKPYQQTRKIFYNKLQKLDWVTGAFLMLKRKVIDKVGIFNDSFFMYSEEVEYCLRAKKAGFNVFYNPKAQIIHLKGKSSLNGLETAVIGEFKGLIRLYMIHKSKLELMILKLLLKTGALLRIFIFGILIRDINKKEIYEKAYHVV